MAIQLDAIDVSSWQREVDFTRVRAAGIQNVILRCGFTGYGRSHSKNKDDYFEQNYAAAKAAGLHVGAYYYSCAVTPAEGVAEAEFVLSLLRGKQLELPVYFDTEDDHDITAPGVYPQSQASIGRTALTAVARAFLERVEDAGYFVGIYASKYWLENRLNMAALTAYSVWVAQYAARCTYGGAYAAWQYTSTGTVDGVRGNVDKNFLYADFASIIRRAGLNGFSAQTAPIGGAGESPPADNAGESPPADNTGEKVLAGDINGDGAVTAEDVWLALRASVGLETLTPAQARAADMDGDGTVTAEDARLILRRAEGLEERK